MRTLFSSVSRPAKARDWLFWRAVAAIVCLIAADWLFFGHVMGVSFAVFLAVVALVCAVMNPVRAGKKEVGLGIGILAAGLAPLVYDFNILSVAFGVAALALYSQILSGGRLRAWRDRLVQGLGSVLAGFVRLPRDVRHAVYLEHCRPAKKPWHVGLRLWIVPAVFGLVFLWLFALANPVIESVLNAVNLSFLKDFFSIPRIIFWVMVLGLVWPYLHMSKPRAGGAASFFGGDSPFKRLEDRGFFSRATLLRSLVVFNALFAIQTCLDLAYLWGGLRLPGNLSYADYAHRGAYPLCVTALIAAAFVLAASPRPGEAKFSIGLRSLLMLWVGQNLILVVSSILRLDMYVAAYSLTYLRVGAFLWMGLTGVGLVLLLLKIYGQKGNAWLIGANALTTSVTLYLCCFVNFPLLIGNYNVAHISPATTRQGQVDINYLTGLGAQAIPAIDAYIEARQGKGDDVARLENVRATMAWDFRTRQADWRAFGIESWRLERYLDENARPEADEPARQQVY